MTALLMMLIATCGTVAAEPASAAPRTVATGSAFHDTAGATIQAHGGGILKVGNLYYWFGENRNDDNSFHSVSIYRSADLKNWTSRGDALNQRSATELQSANVERPKVLYDAKTKQFIMWMHKETASDYTQARVAIATSPTVDGSYTYRGSFRPLGFESRDMTLFQDTDGSSYLVSSSNGNADLHIYRLSDDGTEISSLVSTPSNGLYREAPALFKRGGVYFLLSSTTSGWAPNQQQYMTATSLLGPWSPLAVVGDATTYRSQTAFVLQVVGAQQTSYLYLGDRWGNSMGSNVNGSEYVWLPLSFPTPHSMVLPYFPKISVDTASGDIRGLGGGPYATLRSSTEDLCVAVAGADSANATAIVMSTCTSSWDQTFRLTKDALGDISFVALHSGRCLDVAGSSTSPGAPVLQYDCNEGLNQRWIERRTSAGAVNVVAQHSGQCLTAGPALELVQSPCDGSAAQRFIVR